MDQLNDGLRRFVGMMVRKDVADDVLLACNKDRLVQDEECRRSQGTCVGQPGAVHPQPSTNLHLHLEGH